LISLYEFFQNNDFDRPERQGHGAKVPGSKMARERNGQGTKGPGSELARERVGQAAKRPESYWPICSVERIGPGAKRLGTVKKEVRISCAIAPVYCTSTLISSEVNSIWTWL